MKILTALLVLAAGAGLLQAQTASSVTGKWKVHTVIVQESDANCTFTQKDSDLTGECDGDNGKFAITGKVEWNKVTWSYKTEFNGSPLTISYSGTVDGGAKIAGTATVTEMSLDGEFTAVKDTDNAVK